jgi:5-methyltetrahydrofolate--homocysteine methyltransferase
MFSAPEAAGNIFERTARNNFYHVRYFLMAVFANTERIFAMLDLQKRTSPFLLDGVVGTRLQKRGMPRGVCTAKWILEHPKDLLDIQRSYAEAGSEAVYAPTFGVTRVELQRYGIRDSVHDMNRHLVELSREAVPGLLLGGDLSPTGLSAPPAGTATFAELFDVFSEQAAALEEAGVDFFVAETQMSLFEARAAFLAVQSVSKKPVLVSFACGSSGRGIYGGNLTAILLVFQQMGAAAFGINCCGDLELIGRLLREMQLYAEIPLLAKPNAGLPVLKDGETVFPMAPEELAAAAPGFVGAGAALLGGCCGTDDRHIAALRDAICDLHVHAPAPQAGETYASEYRFVHFSSQTAVERIPVTDNLEEDASDALEKGAEMLYLELSDIKAVRTLLERQSALKLPLWVHCPDGEIRAEFLRLYNGKPKIE